MSDIALGARARPPSTFRAATIGLMLLIGIVGFAGVLVLGAYAPDLRSGRNGGTHALSNAAVGFSGLYRLAGATGHHPIIVRNDHDYGSEDLLIVTPDSGSVQIGGPLRARPGKPTLLILPKWATSRDTRHSGWVTADGLLDRTDPGRTLGPGVIFTIRRLATERRPLNAARDIAALPRFVAPRTTQAITAVRHRRGAHPVTFHPLVGDGHGGIVVGQLGPGPLYIVADPDLFSNIGMADPRQARAALALIDWLNSTGAKSIGFDVTVNGLGRSRSPLRLMFDPPFLAATLVIVATLALLGWHAFGRFGALRPRARVIAFGKRTLVDNSAALIKRAGREARIGHRYVQAIRERAVADFAIPSRIRDAALDDYLDAIGSGRPFTELAQAVIDADDPASLTAAARALYDWHKEKMRAV